MNHSDKNANQSLNIKYSLIYMKEYATYVASKWLYIIILGLLSGVFGFFYAKSKKPLFVAELSFALEEENGLGSGMSGAIGLASSLGLELGGSSSGVFLGSNLIELMKSRYIVERALLTPLKGDSRQISLVDYWIKQNGINLALDTRDDGIKGISFPVNSNRDSFSFQQDSVLGIVFSHIIGDGQSLNVLQKEKKSTIISIIIKSTSELFAKSFAESIAKEVSDFYITTKSKKARANVEVLEKQADSVRRELDKAINGAALATDNVFNLNPSFNIKRVPTTQRQIDIQANSAILTQLLANLELARVALLRETPLIQIIDKPILPLNLEKKSPILHFIFFTVFTVILTIFFFVVRKIVHDIMKED